MSDAKIAKHSEHSSQMIAGVQKFADQEQRTWESHQRHQSPPGTNTRRDRRKRERQNRKAGRSR